MTINKSSLFTSGLVTTVSYVSLSNVTTVLNKVIDNQFAIQNTSNYLHESVTSFQTYTNLFNFNSPISIAGLGAFSWITYKTISTLREGNKKYQDSSDYGSHGTSKFQTEQEIKKKYYKDKFGWFLGTVDLEKTINKEKLFPSREIKPYAYKEGMEAAYHRLNGELNMQALILGPPGSRKTTGFVLPNIFHIVNMYKNKDEKADIIITDPKSELFENTADYLKKNGYDVKVLDFLNLKYGDTLNPLDYIHDEKMLIEICDAFCKATSSVDQEDFWERQKVQLLVAIVGFILQKNEPGKRSFSEALALLGEINKFTGDDLAEIFTSKGVTGAPLQMWNSFCATARSANTRAGITGTLTSSMKLFAVEGIRSLTSSTTIPIEKLGTKKEKPMALFILMPDEDRSFSSIISVIITVIFKQLYKTAHKTNNRLESPVYFMLEEFCSIDPIKNITSLLATMRGRRIYPAIIIQSISQLKDRYKNSWENIISQCDTLISLGVNDKYTANYVSDMLGTTTIKTASSSSSKRSNNTSESESQMYQSRKLLLPDEVLKFDNDKMIVRQRGTDPFLLYKVQYRHWEERFCELTPVTKLPHLPYVDTPVPIHLSKMETKDMEIQKNNEENREIDVFNMDEKLKANEVDEYTL